MNWRHYLILFLVGLIVPFGISRFQSMPGYMDADYYFVGGIQLAEGRGFTEPYLWNYLDNPIRAAPSLAHVLDAACLDCFRHRDVDRRSIDVCRRTLGVHSPFGLVPLVTAALAYSISRRTLLAMVSGFLSIFSLYYTPFMPVPDNYVLYMLFGGIFLLLARAVKNGYPLLWALLAGLLTLARSDGLLWLGLAGLTVMLKSWTKMDGSRTTFTEWLKLIIPAGLLALAGYFIVMGGWHIRTENLFGTFMTPGGGRLLWLENYNQTFIYPPDSLTKAGFLRAGWEAAMQDRLVALSANAGNAFAAQGGIFLFPFILIGLWILRHDLRTKIAVTGWLILFLVMTVIFPFAGSRGSFFHAGAAFQPYWWAAAPIGLDSVIGWARKRGRFTDQNAPVFFQGILVLLAILMTAYLVNIRVISGWAKDDVIYPKVEAEAHR